MNPKEFRNKDIKPNIKPDATEELQGLMDAYDKEIDHLTSVKETVKSNDGCIDAKIEGLCFAKALLKERLDKLKNNAA